MSIFKFLKPSKKQLKNDDNLSQELSKEKKEEQAIQNDQSFETEVLSTDKSEKTNPESNADSHGFFTRLKTSLTKTRSVMGLGDLLKSRKIDEELLEELETKLLSADVGVELTTLIIDELQDKITRKSLQSTDGVASLLKERLLESLLPCEQSLKTESSQKPYIILMVGINGAGKTTTIGKLAKKLKNEGKSVILAAGDTFRAAAVEQLEAWGARNDVPVVAQHTGADSASVIYDAVAHAQARHIDVVIADTAGRLHTKANLMEELKKIVRVIQKLDGTAPHEVMLVLDAAIGQNALTQAVEFKKAVNVSGITLTKMDGTAKGGIVFAIAQKAQIPIRFIGVGEQLEDLQVFNAQEFVEALFASE